MSRFEDGDEEDAFERDVSPMLSVGEGDIDASLRPRSLREFIGQPRVREQLQLVLEGAKKVLTLFAPFAFGWVGVRLENELEAQLDMARIRHFGVTRQTREGAAERAVIRVVGEIPEPVGISVREVEHLQPELEALGLGDGQQRSRNRQPRCYTIDPASQLPELR